MTASSSSGGSSQATTTVAYTRALGAAHEFHRSADGGRRQERMQQHAVEVTAGKLQALGPDRREDQRRHRLIG
jgi:hypothetical protein